MAGRQPPTAERSASGSGSNSRSRNELWSLLTKYLKRRVDCGVSLPCGSCGRIHVKDKRVQLIVERRGYLHSSICTDKDCKTTTVEVFYKNPHKWRALFEGNTSSRKRDPVLVPKIKKSFIQLVDEFASTVKPDKEKNTENLPVLYETCCEGHCDELIYLLEFGKIGALHSYSKEEYAKVMSCYHGGQAVGHHISFFMFYIIQFFIGTKLLMYNEVAFENAPKLCWMYSHACDGQTFLPYQRKNLHLWMKDMDATTRMCKAAFRCIYLFVYLRRRFESEYNIENDEILDLGRDDWISVRCFNSL